MAWVLRISALIGPAAEGGAGAEAAGQYVRSYDPNGYGGRGRLTLTRDVRQARQWLSVGTAMATAQAQSRTHPLRPDGKPNCPLSAYTLEILPYEQQLAEQVAPAGAAKPYGAVIYEAGSRADMANPALRAAEFATLVRANPGAELTVTIGGYDKDPRELFDVPEVMAFLREFMQHLGGLFNSDERKGLLDRFSWECRAMLLLAAGVIRREQIEIKARPVGYGGRA